MTPDLTIKLSINDAANKLSSYQTCLGSLPQFHTPKDFRCQYNFFPLHLHVCNNTDSQLFVRTESSDGTMNERFLTVCLACNWESENKEWSCEMSVDIVLLNKNETLNVNQTFFLVRFHHGTPSAGLSLLSWNTVMDENKGYLVDGTISVEARITIEKVSGVRKVALINFCNPIENITNIVLLVDNKPLHVSKELLSVHSPVFSAMFFKDFAEKGKNEVEIKEVDYDQFVVFLNVVYPTSVEIVARTVGHILALADRFQVESVLDKAESYLIATERIDTVSKLEFADKFRLNRLMIYCLNSYKTTDEMYKMKDTYQFKAFSNDMKAAICERLMELSGN